MLNEGPELRRQIAAIRKEKKEARKCREIGVQDCDQLTTIDIRAKALLQRKRNTAASQGGPDHQTQIIGGYASPPQWYDRQSDINRRPGWLHRRGLLLRDQICRGRPVGYAPERTRPSRDQCHDRRAKRVPTEWAGSSNEVSASIEDYEATAGEARRAYHASVGKQAGDPARAAKAIREAVLAEQPPHHLPLGNDAAEAALKKAEDLKANVLAWEALSRSADFPAN